MANVISEQGAMIDAVANPDATVSRLGGAGHLKSAIARAITAGLDDAASSRLGAQGRIYAIAGGGEISPGLSGGGWSPSALFAASEVGAWYDPSDLSTMWTDDGTTQAAVGDLIYRIDDKSGNGFHAKQTAEASRPILRESGGKYYLEFDGTDDFLVTAAINFTATSQISVFAGIRKLSDAARGMVVELSTSYATPKCFAIDAPNTAAPNYGFGISGSITNLNRLATSFASPISNVVVCNFDLTQTTGNLSVQPRINALVPTLTSVLTDQGVGPFANEALYIGRRAGTSLPLNGNIYSLIIRGALSDATEIANAESYVNGKTGAY